MEDQGVLDYAALLAHLHGMIGTRMRVTLTRWPDADPPYGYLLGYLRRATGGWERVSRAGAGPEAMGFLITESPDSPAALGAFIVSSDHFHAARVLDDGMVGIHVGGLIMGLAPEP